MNRSFHFPAANRLRSAPSRGPSPRDGSALVIVLGLLAVMMLMAVAFVVAMRTERGGSSNQRHATVARQMLDTAIVRALADLDQHLGPEPAPPWMVYGSTNRLPSTHQSASVLSHESAQHLSPDQRMAVLNANPGWLPITGGIENTTADDPILGRYAYVIVNNTGYLDANLVGGASSRTNGLALDEIRLWDTAEGKGLGSFASEDDADDFVNNRRDLHGRYESFDEFIRLTAANIARNFEISASPKFSTNEFALTSFSLPELAPIEPGSVTAANPYGIRRPKVVVSRERLTSQYALFESEARAAFAKVFENVRSCWSKGSPANKGTARNSQTPYGAHPTEPWIPQEQVAFAALCDYLDDDLVPGMNLATGQSYYPAGVNRLDRPVTEPIAMIDRFVFYMSHEPGEPVYTKEAIYDEDDPGTIIAYRHLFHLNLQVLSIYLNRTIPPALQGKGFNVSFAADHVAVALVDESGDPAPIASMPETRDSLNAALGAWAAGAIAGSYTHTPNLSIAATDVELPLQFESPVSELPPGTDLPEFQINVNLVGLVEFEGQQVQLVPGPTFQARNHPLRVGVILDAEELMDGSRVGWAYVADPRFGYETSLSTLVWMTRDRARMIQTENLEPGLRNWIDQIEQVDNNLHDGKIDMLNPYFAFLLKDATALAFTGRGDEEYNLRMFEWSDALYSGRQGQDDFMQSALMMVRSGDMLSIGEMGNLVLAPLRTIALFDGVLPSEPEIVIPRHRVLDYFTLGNANRHRVNLNPPFAVEARSTGAGGAARIVSDESNHYGPLTAVFAGLPLNEIAMPQGEIAKKRLPWSFAQELARTLAEEVLWWENPTPINPNENLDLAYSLNGVAYDISVLGRAPPGAAGPGRQPADPSRTLDRVLLSLADPSRAPRSDFEREGLIRNSVELLTTRQQVFTLLIRADAFTPRFGFDDAGQGTTLSSAHSIVELWRDPEPRRNPATGEPEWATLPDGSQTAVHNWFIRYQKQF